MALHRVGRNAFVSRLQHVGVWQLHGGCSDRELYNIWSPDFTGGDQSGGEGGVVSVKAELICLLHGLHLLEEDGGTDCSAG